MLVSLITLLALTSTAPTVQAAFKTKTAKNFLAVKSTKAINDWTKEFIGVLNFKLTDDSIYREQLTNLQNLEAELNRVTKMLEDKKTELKNIQNTKTAKVADLDKTQKSLADKNKLKTDLEKEVSLLTTKVESLTNSISSNQNLIRIQQEDLQKLNQELEFWSSELDTAKLSVNSLQQQFNTALANCQQANPQADCTADQAVVYAKEMLDRAIQRKNYLQTQFNAVDTRVKEANAKITKANQDIASANTQITDAQTKIQSNNQTIANLNNELPTLISKVGELTQEIKVLANQENTLTDDVKRMTSIYESQGASFLTAKNSFEKLEKDLIDQILSMNKLGNEKAKNDGAQEGIEIAQNIGGNQGAILGSQEGIKKGEMDGRARDYQIGARQGEGDGAKDGKFEGDKSGKLEGKQAGFKAAGAKEGEASGIQKAVNSDASSVGANLGRQAGMQRAVSTGLAQGSKLGEEQAIKDNEDDTLSQLMINGQFTGTFQSGSIPKFPGVSGKYFNSNINNSRKILKDSYVAGYNAGYAISAERTYFQNFQAIYNQAFQNAYQDSYNQSFSIVYEDSIRDGRGAQYASAFDREYKISYQPAFKQAFDQALNAPDRSGSIFINAFKTAEEDAFETKYNEIKTKAFKVSEQDVFNQNISSQTEKARSERYSQVQKLYSSLPVLKFNSSSITDIGLRGVGTQDGFFMPGEEISHNLVITNFSMASANNVRVTLKNGESFTLPAIPGKSVVTIIGAAKEKISPAQAVNSSLTTNITAKLSLNSTEKAIQGRHFVNPQEGILNNADSKNFKVEFPLQVSELKFNEALILGKAVAVRASILNKSQKDFSNVRLELDTTLGRGILTQEFSTISLIDQAVTKTDAIVKIDDSDLIFTEVGLDLNLTVGGVVVGKLTQAKADFVKVPFKNIQGSPVIVTSSANVENREVFKDLAAEMGGINQVSLLDLASFAENQNILDTKLAGKTVIVIDQSKSLVATKLNGLLKTANTATLLIGEGNAEGILNVVKNSSNVTQDSTALTLVVNREKMKMVSSSPVLADGVAQRTTAVEVKFNQLSTGLKIAEILKLKEDVLLDRISNTVTKDAFLSREDNAVSMIKIMNLRLTEDALDINTGFKAADKRRDRKDWKNRFEDDSNLMSNKLLARMKTEEIEGKVALSMAAITGQTLLENLVENDSFERKVAKAVKSSGSDLEKLAKKNFKQANDKNLIDAVKRIEGSYTPTATN